VISAFERSTNLPATQGEINKKFDARADKAEAQLKALIEH
jgi:hypothetical protein